MKGTYAKILVPTSKNTHLVSIKRLGWLVMLREGISVYSEIKQNT
jgi:hypothetical protein